MFRKPFTPEELKAILDAAQGDEFIRPVLVTRRLHCNEARDCCLLQWFDVDLEKRFLTVKTAKTGQTVSIPIFPLLFDELAARQKSGKGYVFPEQAAMYLEKSDGITWRVREVFAAAGFKDESNGNEGCGEVDRSGETGNDAVVHRGDVHYPTEGWLASGIGAGFPRFRVTTG